MTACSVGWKKWCLGIVGAGTLCHAQLQTPQHEVVRPTLIHTTSPLVIIPGLVRSKSGDFVSGLTSKDFAVADNGVEQGTVLVEQTKDKPLAVVLVMQTGAAARREFQHYRTVTKLLEIVAGTPVQKVALVTFDSKPEEIWNFPVRLDGVSYAMDNPDAGDGGAAILDAVSKAADLLEEQSPEMRRLIILLSQPRDSGSTTKSVSFMQRLGRLNAPIYSLSFSSPAARGGRGAERACPNDDGSESWSKTMSTPSVQRIRKSLCQDTSAELATASGGEHLQVKNQSDLDRSVSRLSDAFSNAYTISFKPAFPSPGFHFLSLKVGTKDAHLVVSARNLYWVP
jgi:VWFA-related protein